MARNALMVVLVCASLFLPPSLVSRGDEQKTPPAAEKAQPELPSVDTILAQTEEKMKDVREIVADLRMTTSVAGLAEPVTTVGSMKVLTPAMFLLEGKTEKTPGSNEEPALRSIKLVSKGGVMFQLLEATEKEESVCIRMDEAEIRKIIKEYADVPGFKLDVPRSPDYIHYLKNERASGSTLKIVSVKDGRATVECNSPGGERREVAVLDLNNGWLVKEDTYREGKLDITIELSNIRTNTGLKESEFEYTPPAGTRVVDVAKVFKSMAESARKWAERQKAEQEAKKSEQAAPAERQ